LGRPAISAALRRNLKRLGDAGIGAEALVIDSLALRGKSTRAEEDVEPVLENLAAVTKCTSLDGEKTGGRTKGLDQRILLGNLSWGTSRSREPAWTAPKERGDKSSGPPGELLRRST